jgi:hypothetical protein
MPFFYFIKAIFACLFYGLIYGFWFLEYKGLIFKVNLKEVRFRE